MATPHRTPARPAPAIPPSTVAPVAPVAEWTVLMLNPMLEAQRLQWQAMLCWQQAMATMQKDVWEQWAVQYGGGVPIDG